MKGEAASAASLFLWVRGPTAENENARGIRHGRVRSDRAASLVQAAEQPDQ
jgi:hypothetical protein